MSTLRLDTIQDQAGNNASTPDEIYSGRAKAWVNFDGTFGTSPFTTANGGIRAAFNVSSVIDEGTGDYRIILTSSLGDNDYSVTLSSTVRNNATSSTMTGIRSSAADWVSGANAMSSTSVRVLNRASSAVNVDVDVVCASFFR